ncbi:MAG: amidohydrolase family protein [Planctomycetes bacterium]|nr:amidohydrolase family protein [Planctomycetota bacterium]
MDRHPKSNAYHVEWYIDGEQPQNNVTVWIDSGRIVGVDAGCSTGAIKLGRVALIPGLVNAHTHLEFSLLQEPIPTAGRFTDWIRAVVTYRREHPDIAARAIRHGIQQCWRSGTTLIGEIATTGWTADDYLSNSFAGIVYQEVLGLGEERTAAQCELAQTIAAEFPPMFGLSPHAPYSVHPDLLRASIELTKEHSRPIAMHLAETPAEIELLAHRKGEFREMLTEFGIWRDGLFAPKPLNYLRRLAEAPRALVVHGNYLDDTELNFLADNRQMTLVYCPRTHAAFGHERHPWRKLLDLGGNVAIGTDSRASNPDLSLFAELQFLASRHPDVSHLELLWLGSTAGRMALLGEGADRAAADLCVVSFAVPSAKDPCRALFVPGNRVIGTMLGGAWVHAEGLPVTVEVSAPG